MIKVRKWVITIRGKIKNRHLTVWSDIPQHTIVSFLVTLYTVLRGYWLVYNTMIKQEKMLEELIKKHDIKG